jgi:hypothetical protein
MLLSRRTLFTTLVSLPYTNPDLKYVKLPIRGRPCVSGDVRDEWKESARLFSIRANVMTGAQKFYMGLWKDDNMSQETFASFVTVREIANIYTEYQPIVDMMRSDAAYFMNMSDCLSA